MIMVSVRLMLEDRRLFKDVAKQKQFTMLYLDRRLVQVVSLAVNERLQDKANLQILVMFFSTQ